MITYTLKENARGRFLMIVRENENVVFISEEWDAQKAGSMLGDMLTGATVEHMLNTYVTMLDPTDAEETARLLAEWADCTTIGETNALYFDRAGQEGTTALYVADFLRDERAALEHCMTLDEVADLIDAQPEKWDWSDDERKRVFRLAAHRLGVLFAAHGEPYPFSALALSAERIGEELCLLRSVNLRWEAMNDDGDWEEVETAAEAGRVELSVELLSRHDSDVAEMVANILPGEFWAEVDQEQDDKQIWYRFEFGEKMEEYRRRSLTLRLEEALHAWRRGCDATVFFPRGEVDRSHIDAYLNGGGVELEEFDEEELASLAVEYVKMFQMELF